MVHKILDFDTCFRIKKRRILQKVLVITFHLLFRIHVYQKLQVWLLESRSQGQIRHHYGALDEKIIDLDPCIRILIAQIFQKVLSVLMYFEIQTQFLENTGLPLVHQSRNQKIYIWKKRFDWTTVELVHCMKIRIAQQLKSVLIIDWSRNWKSYFYVATGLVSSIKTSIDHFFLVEAIIFFINISMDIPLIAQEFLVLKALSSFFALDHW